MTSPIVYRPSIIKRPLMDLKTHEVLSRLRACHDYQPCMSVQISDRDMDLGASPTIGNPAFYCTYPKGFVRMDTKNASEHFPRDIIQEALVQFHCDVEIRHFVAALMTETRSRLFGEAKGPVEMLIMPGALVLRARHSGLKTLMKEIIEKDPDPATMPYCNLGVFAVDPYETTHEAFERQATLKSLRSTWRPFLDELEDTMSDFLKIEDPNATKKQPLHIPSTQERFRQMFKKRIRSSK